MKITTHHHWLVFSITSTISFLVYLQTISPSIAGGDSGELVAEGCQLGTSHPPGYPLYTIIVYLATTLGKGITSGKSPAFFVNITSAMFGSIASGILSSCILLMLEIDERHSDHICRAKGRSRTHSSSKKYKKKTKDLCENNSNSSTTSPDVINYHEMNIMMMHVAVFIGLMHSFSPLAWQYSVTAEVFALHNLFVALIVHTTLRFACHGSTALLLWGSFVCGLALTNQHTSVLLSIPLITWVLHVTKLYWPSRWGKIEYFVQLGNEGRKKKSVHLLTFAAMSFLSGFVLLYATMPLFSFLFPHAGSWGNVTSISGFVHHFTRKDYGSLRLYSGNDNGSENMMERLVLWAKDFLWRQSFPFVGACSMIAFKDMLIREGKKWRIQRKKVLKGSYITGVVLLGDEDSIGVDTAILCSLIFYLIVFGSLANLPLKNPLFFGIHQRFWMHPNLLCFILSGVGLTKLCKKVTKKSIQRINYCNCTLILLCVYAYCKNYSSSDQGKNVYFRNYAASILETLPQNSVLFINYDQQWTSVRYMQECEGVRSDVTSINLSMMSYGWWSTKHDLYPQISFPGSHYSYERGGFSFAELLDANHAFDGNVFIGGTLSYRDDSYSRRYDEVPHGIVRKIVRKVDNAGVSAETYRRESLEHWRIIAKEHTQGLPPLSQYSDDTWEWTVRREFFEHFVSRASHLLDLAVSNDSTDPSNLKSIVEACAWLEAARLNDDISNESPAIWKNLGLAYMNMVRNNEESFPDVTNLFEDTTNAFFIESLKEFWWSRGDRIDWKGWSSVQWKRVWGHFLDMDAARNDPSFEQIKSIYNSVLERTVTS